MLIGVVNLSCKFEIYASQCVTLNKWLGEYCGFRINQCKRIDRGLTNINCDHGGTRRKVLKHSFESFVFKRDV